MESRNEIQGPSSVTIESGWIKITLGISAALGVWLLWGFWGASYFKGRLCPNDDSCTALGQVGDIFGGVNALVGALALAAIAYSTHLSRRSFEEGQRRTQEAFEEEQRNTRKAFEEEQIDSREASAEALRSTRELFEVQQQREFDLGNLEQIRKSYAWAYEVLKEDGIEGPPRNRRLAWLTAARHLLSAQELVAAIKTPAYRTIHGEEALHWRTKFHRLLDHPRLAEPSFFHAAPPEKFASIHVASALAVLDFSMWKEGEVDRVDMVNRAELLERVAGVTGAYRGMERYVVAEHPAILKEWSEYRAKLSKPPADHPDILAE